MEAVLDGVRKAASLSDECVASRTAVADAARDYEWPLLLALLEQHPELINNARLDGPSLYAPLHQAAHGGAPVEVAERLIRGLGVQAPLTR